MFPAGRILEICFSSQWGKNGPGENVVHVDLMLRFIFTKWEDWLVQDFSVFHSKLGIKTFSGQSLQAYFSCKIWDKTLESTHFLLVMSSCGTLHCSSQKSLAPISTCCVGDTEIPTCPLCCLFPSHRLLESWT